MNSPVFTIPTTVFLLIICQSVAAVTRTVSTIAELLEANSAAASGDTILLGDGTYTIDSYGIAVRSDNIVFRGLSGDRSKVIVSGKGMNNSTVGFGFWVAADTVTIADLTICNVYNHCIQTDVNTDALHVKNCVLRDAREQLLKVPYNSAVDDPSENGLVEGCAFLFTDGVAAQYYTGGVDCHFAKNWIIRNNTFSGIRSPENTIAEHAVHFWTRSEGTVVENNLIANCDRGIGFGLGDSPHFGGSIKNNMIWHDRFSGLDNGDVGIGLESCTGTKVLNNTIYFLHDYQNAIEYRFEATSEVQIVNNLTNRSIRERNGGSATLEGNVTGAERTWFADASSGDLHLTSSAAAAIDKGVTVAEVTVDFEGQVRSEGTYDVGADEFSTDGVLRMWSLYARKNDRLHSQLMIHCEQRRMSFPAGVMLRDLRGRTVSGRAAAGMVVRMGLE